MKLESEKLNIVDLTDLDEFTLSEIEIGLCEIAKDLQEIANENTQICFAVFFCNSCFNHWQIDFQPLEKHLLEDEVCPNCNSVDADFTIQKF